MRFRKLATMVAGVAAVMILVAQKVRADDWVINGEVQMFIPFWYTLQEAVCRYMISSGCF